MVDPIQEEMMENQSDIPAPMHEQLEENLGEKNLIQSNITVEQDKILIKQRKSLSYTKGMIEFKDFPNSFEKKVIIEGIRNFLLFLRKPTHPLTDHVECQRNIVAVKDSVN